MIECRKCGSENHFDGAVFCKHCGERLGAAVAVDVADPPAQLIDNRSKIDAGDTSATVARSDGDFEVESVADPEPQGPAAKGEPTGGGIDKLLSLYGNESKVENAKSLDLDEAPNTSDLGIESAEDYLIQKQADEPVDEPAKLPADRLAQLEAKLKKIDDSPEPPLHTAPQPATVAPADLAAVSVTEDDKGQLIESLRRRLNSEQAQKDAVVQQQAVNSPANQAVDSTSDPEASATSPDPSSEDSTTGAIPPIEAIASSPVIEFRGRRLTVPANVRLHSGDEVVIRGETYSLKAGGIDKRSWILGGILGGVLLLILIVQSLNTPTPPKATLFGVVTNSESNVVLAGINVSIPQANLQTVTDEYGAFKIDGLPDGRYDVKLEGELYEARFFPVFVQNGKTDFLSGTVTPILPQGRTSYTAPQTSSLPVGEEKPEFGQLKIACNVSDASVFIDGKLLGKVSQTFRRMKPGSRSVEIRADGYTSHLQALTITEGETTEIAVNLQSSASSQPVEYSAEDFFNQAEALFAENKYTEAIGYYTLALAKDNTMVKALLRRAEAHLAANKKLNARADYRSAADLYINSGMFAQAISCYDRIIGFAPDASDAYSLRGWARISSGNYDGGVQDLEKALTFTPEDPTAQLELGRAFYLVGRYKDAEKLLKKLRKFGEDNPEIYGYLALTNLSLGDEGDARKNLEQFRKRASSALVARMSTESGWQRLTALAGN